MTTLLGPTHHFPIACVVHAKLLSDHPNPVLDLIVDIVVLIPPPSSAHNIRHEP